MSTHTSPSSTKSISEEKKLKQISDLIEKLNWEPKSYIAHFLNTQSAASVFKRQYWGSQGWPGTRRLLDSIKAVVGKHNPGKLLWEEFILEEVNFFHSFSNLTHDFPCLSIYY
jgi:hypothetical protein